MNKKRAYKKRRLKNKDETKKIKHELKTKEIKVKIEEATEENRFILEI